MAYAYAGVFNMYYIHHNKNASRYKEVRWDGVIPEYTYNNERVAYFIRRAKAEASSSYTYVFMCSTVLTNSKIVDSNELRMTPYSLTDTTIYWDGREETNTQTTSNRMLGHYNKPDPDDPTTEMFGSTIPIFDSEDTESINKYVNNGDTSGALKDVSTKWKLYIDGTKNPLYKLTWNCADIPSSDT